MVLLLVIINIESSVSIKYQKSVQWFEGHDNKIKCISVQQINDKVI